MGYDIVSFASRLSDLHALNPSNFTRLLWKKSSLARKVRILQIQSTWIWQCRIEVETAGDEASGWSYGNEDDSLAVYRWAACRWRMAWKLPKETTRKSSGRERVEETSWKPRTCSRVVRFPALYAYIRFSHLSCLCAFLHVLVSYLDSKSVWSEEQIRKSWPLICCPKRITVTELRYV